MTALWADIQDEIQRQLATVGARVYKAGAASGGRRKLRLDPASSDDSGELYALLKGLPKFAAGDDVAVIMLGGKPFILGPTQNTAQTAITYDLPIIGEQGFNSPFGSQVSQNSADVLSSTDTADYVTTLTTNLVLPTGTWTVRALSFQMLSHSSAGNVVRARTRVAGTAGTSMSAAVPADPTRETLASQAVVTGQSGTVAVDAQYRPNASGTAYSGGGLLFIMAFRTS